MLVCAGLMSAQAATVRTTMQVSALTITSAETIRLVIVDEHHAYDAVQRDSDRDATAAAYREVIRSLLEQLKLPKAIPFMLSFEGAFADMFQVNMRQHRVMIRRGSGRLPEHGVITLLLRY